MSANLGLKIDKLDNGTVVLTQPAFIEHIIQATNLKDQHMHDTPADVVLHRDEEGPERKTEFHYRSIIGQLNYLAATTRRGSVSQPRDRRGSAYFASVARVTSAARTREPLRRVAMTLRR